MRAPLPRAGVRSISADVCPDPLDGSADKDDSRHATLHSALRKNRHSRALVFSPSKWAGKKFQSCERRRKRFPQSSDRDSPGRDTSFRTEEEVLVFSCAFDPERVTTAVCTACIHKRSLGILQQRFNDCLRFVSIYWFGIDHVVICIVSAEDAAAAKIRRNFACCCVALARLFVNENRPRLRIRMTRWNRRIRKENDPLAHLRPAQTMSARKSVRRFRHDDGVIGCASLCCAPRCVGNLCGKRNNLEIQSFHVDS